MTVEWSRTVGTRQQVATERVLGDYSTGHRVCEVNDFLEVGERCWVRRYDDLDVNVGVIAGEDGLLIVDALATSEAGIGLREVLASRFEAPVLSVVNTHHHFDHVGGNQAFAAVGADVIAHEGAAALIDGTPPNRTFSSALSLDLGGRLVEVIHPGRGHTAGDVIVRIEDADVVYVGDLVEESALRDAVPDFGDDCYPFEWPTSLDLVLSLLGSASKVVPGHGAPVDREFVHAQRASIGVVAETIRDLAGRGVPLDAALDAAEWPFPRAELANAVRRGDGAAAPVRQAIAVDLTISDSADVDPAGTTRAHPKG